MSYTLYTCQETISRGKTKKARANAERSEAYRALRDMPRCARHVNKGYKLPIYFTASVAAIAPSEAAVTS